MIPRLKASKKWTNLPKDFLAQVEEVFNNNFAEESKIGSFKAEGRVYPTEIVLRVGYLEKGRLKQCNLEVSVNLAANEEAIKKIHLCVDALGSLFVDYFEAIEGGSEDPTEELDIPLVWKEFPFQDEKIFLQYSTVNSDLELEADRLLGVDENLLVREIDEDDEEEVLAAAESLLEEQDSDQEESAPRMFGKLPPKNSKKNKLH